MKPLIIKIQILELYKEPETSNIEKIVKKKSANLTGL